MDRTDELFRILGDPTRRAILDLLAQREVMTVGEIHAHFPTLVRSSISKHLMALREAELVYASKAGRHQYYRIHAQTIQDLLKPWVAKYEKYWDERLNRLRIAAEALEQKRRE
jgi:DNA-binding transcriptional ArsR family regulator